MTPNDLPLYLQHLLHMPSFPPHHGSATIECIGEPNHPWSQFMRMAREHLGQDNREVSEYELPAIVFTPVTGQCLVAVRGNRQLFSKNFGTNLRVRGTFNDRPFEFHAPQFRCRPGLGRGDGEGWATFEPVNAAATLDYVSTSPISEVRALQLNFCLDFDSDDPRPLTVTASGRAVRFFPVPLYRDVLPLMHLEGCDSAPTSEIRFAPWPDSTPTELSEFAWSVARCCSFVAQQQTNLVQLSTVGDDGQPVRIEFYSPIRSAFRERCLLLGLGFRENGLGQFFSQCFDEFVSLEANPEWRRLFNTAWCYEDGVYLETQAGTLLGAVELLIRTSLAEGGHFSPGKRDKMVLGELIQAAKDQLGWEIPEHYTVLDQYRHLRNKAAHVMPLPCSPREALDLVQKWGLFLYRRLLIRLGYRGRVRSANKGFSSFSPVTDFSEDQNSFAHGD